MKKEKALLEAEKFLRRWLCSFEMNQKSIRFKVYQTWLLLKLNWSAWRAKVPAESLVREVLDRWNVTL